jgi:hypothetical protein
MKKKEIKEIVKAEGMMGQKEEVLGNALTDMNGT